MHSTARRPPKTHSTARSPPKAAYRAPKGLHFKCLSRGHHGVELQRHVRLPQAVDVPLQLPPAKQGRPCAAVEKHQGRVACLDHSLPTCLSTSPGDQSSMANSFE